MKRIYSLLIFLIISQISNAQDFNKFDELGKRDGLWRKNFDSTEVLRYEGKFLHGKEVGVFKYYTNVKNKAVLSATKKFNEIDNIAEVKFYSTKEKVISEGKMNGKLYIGTWKYYHDNSNKLLTLENYNDQGQLVGERIVYFKDGEIAEKQNYKDGVLQGESILYSEKGVMLKYFIFENGELHGVSKIYDTKGQLITEGAYKKGKKDGVWKYYEDNKLTKEKDYTYIPKYLKVDGKFVKNPKYVEPKKAE